MNIKKLSENATIPTRGSNGAAGYDLYSTEDYILKPGERKLFKTDISLAVPPGYYGHISPRSGLAYKNGIAVMGGIIDEDFRGNVGVILLNSNPEIPWNDENMLDEEIQDENKKNTLQIKKGDRIAQIIFHKYFEADFVEVENLDKTVRAEKGWGSSGA